MANKKKIIRHSWGIFLYILLGVFVLFLLLFIFIYTPPGKRVVRARVQNFLENKLHTKVVIGAVDYSLPQWLEIKGVYIEDQRRDTLLYGEEISADLNMFKLLRGNTDIQKLFFKNILINVNRKKTDSVFNYQFVVDAFTGNKSSTAIPDTAALKMSLDHLIFDNVAFRSKDEYGGQDFVARIKNLDATLNKFQPDRINFGLRDFTASGVDFFMSSYAPSVRDSLIMEAKDTVKPASTYGLYMTAGHFNVRDVNVTIEDKVTGMFYSNKVTRLGLSNALLNVKQSIIVSDSLLLDSSYIKFIQPQQKTVHLVDTTVAPWLIQSGQLNIANSEFEYDDVNSPKTGGFDFAHFDAKNIKTDIRSFIYSEDSTSAKISHLAFQDKSGFAIDTLRTDFLFTEKTLSATSLFLKTPESVIQNSIEIRYDSIAAMKLRPQASLLNAVLDNSVISFNDLYRLFPFLTKSLDPKLFANLSLRLNTELRGNLERVYLPYLQLQGLSGSSLSGHGTLFNLTDAKRFSYDLVIDRSQIQKKDLLKFIPAQNLEAAAKLPAVFNISGHFVGDRNNLVANMRATSKDLSFAGIVTLNGISNPATMKYDLAVASASFDRNLLIGFFPKGTIPDYVSLPQRITASGKFKGSTNDFVADLKLNGSYGGASIKGFMRNMKNKEATVYDLFITANNFQLGKFLKQEPELGNATGSLHMKGVGLNYKTMRADYDADIAALQYHGYNYNDAQVKANFNRGTLTSNGNINDNAIRLQYNGVSNVAGAYPTFRGRVTADTVMLGRLNWIKDTLNFSGAADIDAVSTKPRALDFTAFMENIKLQAGQRKVALDTVSFVGSSNNGVDDIRLNSDIADLHANGAFDYDKVMLSLEQYVNHYYRFTNTKMPSNLPDQQVVFEGVIRKSPVLTTLVPGLRDYQDITFDGSYNSTYGDSALSLNAAIPYLDYSDYTIRNGKFNTSSRNERLNYALSFDTLKYLARTFYGTKVDGSAAHDSVDIKAITQDNNKRDWFGAHAALTLAGETVNFKLMDNLLLNYEPWTVASDNRISFGPQGVLVNNFLIKSDTSTISLNSRQPVYNSPIDVRIDNFNLQSISSFVSTDSVFTTGILDATLVISDLNKAVPGFTGNASVTNLTVMHYPLGNLTAFAEKSSDNVIAAKMELTGNGNDVVANGNYFLNDVNNQFTADVDIRRLNFATIQAFSAGTLSQASGNITGNLKLNGKFMDPRWSGRIAFDTTRFVLAQFGAPYHINNQEITLDYPGINFNNLVITDSLGHEMKINGKMTAQALTKFDLDMTVKAEDFIVMDAPKAISNQVYGFASVDTDIKLSGTSEKPSVEGNVHVNDKSNITIVLPETSYNKDDAKTVVRFIDRDTFAVNPPTVGFEPAEEIAPNFAAFINYNLNIDVSKNTILNVIVDPATGDQLTVQGDAQLNAGVDPGGNIIIAGNYLLDQGTYTLNYQFIQRKFTLLRGSTITFAGNPMDARINITAQYTANTSPQDLLSNEVSSISPTLSNSFRQKIPFQVMLYLSGVLSRPDINFDILMPEESNLISADLRTTVENKLNQLRGDVAALNKQVFALLLLNRFVGEQSSDFFKGNSGDFTDLARQSVSQFLSSALNEIASDLFKGIDVDLNLNSYRDFSNNGDQQRTDLSVALSKSFLDDRLVISVGKNFGIQGDEQAGKVNDPKNGFMPDVTISYKLTKDGKYLVRAYRKNQFEVIMDGYVVETGVAFVVTLDYDKFNELLKRRKK